MTFLVVTNNSANVWQKAKSLAPVNWWK